ncbi:MAG: germination protein YpeB [Clostridiales bacterium]|nr:MAG: germination protein YpeB [Clostridiales bacterium]
MLANEDKKADIGSSAEKKWKKEFEEYPSLIYDGPFSDHINKISAKMLAKTNKITEQHAMEIAKEFF